MELPHFNNLPSPLMKTLLDSNKKPIRFSAVVAMAQDRAIGKDGSMPWHLPEDLKVFRTLTTGHPVVMGRKTYESIGRPLPKRQNIIITRQKDLAIEGCEVIHDIEELAKLDLMDLEVMIIGGSEIYALMLPHISTLWVSRVKGHFEADTYFPDFKGTFQHKELMESFDSFDLVRFTR